MLNMYDMRHVNCYGKYKESNEIGRNEKSCFQVGRGGGILDNSVFWGLNKLELITQT